MNKRGPHRRCFAINFTNFSATSVFRTSKIASEISSSKSTRKILGLCRNIDSRKKSVHRSCVIFVIKEQMSRGNGTEHFQLSKIEKFEYREKMRVYFEW